MNRQAGLTVLEVVVALAILAVSLGALTSLLIASMRRNLESGKRTEAALLLNHLGRLQVGGDPRLLAPPDRELLWDYGELPSSFPELRGGSNLSQPELYRVRVRNLGVPSAARDLGVGLNAYRIEVCWKEAGRESCIFGETIAPPPGGSGTPPPLPIIN